MVDSSTDQLTYQSHSTLEQKRNLRKFYLVYLIATFAVAIVMILFLLNVVPFVKEQFKTFKMALPLLTDYCLTASDLCRAGWWLAIVPIVILVPFIPAKFTNDQRTVFRGSLVAVIYLSLLFLISSAFFALMMFAFFFPMTNLIQSITSGPP